MSNSVVLITGALTGIGRAAAVAFAKKGAKVVIAGRRDEAGKALVKELCSLGSEAEFINTDVRKDDDVEIFDGTVDRPFRLSRDHMGQFLRRFALICNPRNFAPYRQSMEADPLAAA